MAKLFSVSFAAGRPRLTPAEEKGIVEQAGEASVQEPLRNPSTVLVVIGYANDGSTADEEKRTAFRRAQLVIDLLHDKCHFAGSCQAAAVSIKELPDKERPDKDCKVDVWMIDP